MGGWGREEEVREEMPEKQKKEERKRKREARSSLEGGKGENKNWVGNRDHSRRESHCGPVKEGGDKGVKRRGEEERHMEKTRQRGEAKMKERRNEQGWAAGGRGDSSALTVILNYCLMFSVSICSLIFCAAH